MRAVRPGCLQTIILEGVILYMHVCVHLRRPQGKPPLVSVGLCAHAFYSLKKIAHSAHATYCTHFSPNLCDSLCFLPIFASKFDNFGVYLGGVPPQRRSAAPKTLFGHLGRVYVWFLVDFGLILGTIWGSIWMFFCRIFGPEFWPAFWWHIWQI